MAKARYWLRWINILLILATLAAYSAPLFSPTRGWLPALLAVFFPWLIFGNVLFILFWAFLRSRNAFFSLACLLLGWGHVNSFVGMNRPRQPTESAQVIRVASLNAHSLYDWSNASELASPDDFIALIEASEADIFCFQEFYNSETPDFLNILREKSPLRYEFAEQGSLAMLSRFPIEQGREVYFQNRTNGYQEADIRIQGQRIRVYNLHLQTNGISADLRQWADEREEVVPSTHLGRLGYLFKQYWRSAQTRAEQAEQVAAAIERSSVPVVLCGDMNDVPLSWVYRRLTRQLVDGFRQRGFGLGTTYAGLLPALRIDYILVDPSIEVLSYQTGKAPFSDHHPIWTRLQLPAR